MISIGYAGLEAFDVILYIGRTLTKLNKRVLIIDLSDTGAMTRTIKHGMGLDSSTSIVNYRDINYTRTIPTSEEFDDFHNGVVIVNFGCYYNNLSNTPIVLDGISVVSSTFPSHVSVIKKLLKRINKDIDNVRVLIRDVINSDDLERVVNSLDLSEKPKRISFIYYNADDYENSINCQVSQVVRFTKISSEMEKYIISEIHNIYPDIKKKVIHKAITMARKGV